MRLSIFAATSAVMATFAMASHANTETFAGLTSLSPVTGTSSISGGTFTSLFGPPNISLETTGVLPSIGDNQFLSLSNSTDQELTLTINPALPNTSGAVWVAVAFRAPVISGTATENDVDILRVQDPTGNLFGLIVADGVLRMASTNGWGATRILSSNVATNPGPNNWVIIAGRVNQSTTAGQAQAKWWLVSTSGVATVAYDDFANNTSTGNGGVGNVNRLQFGATYRFPSSPTDAFVVNIDNVLIAPGTTYATEADFLNAVNQAYLGINPAGVEEWSLFE